MAFWKKKQVTGTDRINQVVALFKDQIQELNSGITEVDAAVKKNDNKVKTAERKLIVLKDKVHAENAGLALSKEIAGNLKANISKLLGTDK
jgi:hypothetical protein